MVKQAGSALVLGAALVGCGLGEGFATATPDETAPEDAQEQTQSAAASARAPGADAGGARPAPRVDRGEGDGADVVSLGDSYMRLPNLVQQPGSEGVDVSLAAIGGKAYRTYAYTGAVLLPPKPVGVKNGVIPGQLAAALRDGADIATVIVSGGANDLGQGSPCNGAKSVAEVAPACKQELDGIVAAVDAFVGQLAAAGVEDLVWVGYGPTATTGDRVVEGAIAYLRADRKAKCVPDDPALGLRCHYVDNVDAAIPTRDGFLPTSEGYEAIARAVLARMKEVGARR